MTGTIPSCARVEERMFELLDGGLAPLAEARDRGHLEACVRCQAILAEHEALLARVRRSLPSPVSALEGEADTVWGLVNRDPRPRSRLRPFAFQAAAVLLGFLAFAAAYVHSGPPSRGFEVVSPNPLLEQLPSWSQVLNGIQRWTSRLHS
jgi:anti-sigma factor RsiW